MLNARRGWGFTRSTMTWLRTLEEEFGNALIPHAAAAESMITSFGC